MKEETTFTAGLKMGYFFAQILFKHVNKLNFHDVSDVIKSMNELQQKLSSD